jgi:type IV secretory pathway protease TraF
MTVLAIVSIALVATVAVPTNGGLPWLIYNASGSAQLGFYGVENRTPSRRDMVVVRPSATLRKLLANHSVLPAACLRSGA